MLYNQRAEIILQQLKLQSTVKVNELSQILKVSVDTVRRDLKAMEQSGLIKCLRGGACLPDSVASLSHFEGREVIHSQLKRQAAKKALKLIKSGDLVAINSGTTNTILAQEMASLTIPFTVLTNNFAAANILMKIPAIRLIFIGGETDALEQSTGINGLCKGQIVFDGKPEELTDRDIERIYETSRENLMLGGRSDEREDTAHCA